MSLYYFHFTGFGRFAGIDSNPAKFTIENLHQQIVSKSRLSGQVKPTLQAPSIVSNTSQYSNYIKSLLLSTSPSLSPNQLEVLADVKVYINTTTLQVDVESVEEYFALKYDEIRAIDESLLESFSLPNTASTTTTTTTNTTMTKPLVNHYLIHIGVHSGAQSIHLEEYAYNHASFRCPDEMFYSPYLEPIRSLKNNQIQCHVLSHKPSSSPPPMPQHNDLAATTCDSSPIVPPSPSKWFIPPQPPGSFPLGQEDGIGDDNNSNPVYTPPLDLAFDCVLQTQLDLNLIYPEVVKIHQSLHQEKEKNEVNAKNETLPICPITITNDPGGFVCNYIYFVSLYYTQFIFPLINQCGKSPSSAMTGGSKYTSLFYHIPQENISSIQNNVNVLLSTIAAIILTDVRRDTSTNDNNSNNNNKPSSSSPLSPHPLLKHITIQQDRFPRKITMDSILSSQSQGQEAIKSNILAQIGQDIAAFLPSSP